VGHDPGKKIALLLSTLALFAGLMTLLPALSVQVKGQQSQTAAAESAVIGGWILLTDDQQVPSDNREMFRVAFTNEGEKLTGTAVIPKMTEARPAGLSCLQLIDPKFDGQELSFKIKDEGVLIAKLKLIGADFVGSYQIENSDEKATLKLTRKE
jgi:hypothetical protein